MEERDNELQAVLTEMLAWFHQFCKMHQLRYYMLGGTMLGAVRHGGFIPWDDDIDVGMPREDYRRLEQLMKENPSDVYILETPNTENPDYFYSYSKLYDTRTTLIENTRVTVKRGVFLDIFPLDGAGDNRQDSIAYYQPIKRNLTLLLSMTTGIREGRKAYKNLAVRLLRCVPKCLLDPKKLLLHIQQMCGQKSFDQCAWIGNFAGAHREKEIVPREVMGEPTEYTFENIRVYGVKDYEAYLTSLYGNWRELPPVEKQVTHHDFISCDLHKSYLEH